MNKYSEINKLDDGFKCLQNEVFYQETAANLFIFTGFKTLTGRLPQYLRATRVRFASLLNHTDITVFILPFSGASSCFFV